MMLLTFAFALTVRRCVEFGLTMTSDEILFRRARAYSRIAKMINKMVREADRRTVEKLKKAGLW